MSPARRGLLAAMGGAAIAAPALPAFAGPQHIGRVEEIVRRLPALDQAMQTAEEIWAMCKGSETEKDRLWSLFGDAASAFFATEDAALEAEPETVTDALLVIAIASTYASRATECDMNHVPTARGHRDAARYGRRAADFLAAATQRDLRALLGPNYDHRSEVEA